MDAMILKEMKQIKILFLIIGILLFPSIAYAFGNISGDWGIETFTGVAGNPSSNWTAGDAPFGLCQLDGNGHLNTSSADCTAKFLYKLPLLSQNVSLNISCSFDMAYSGFNTNSFLVTIKNTSDIYGTHVYNLFDNNGQAIIRAVNTQINTNITGWKNDGTWQHVNMTFLQNRTVQVWINNSLRAQSTPNIANNASMIGLIYADTAGMRIGVDNFTCQYGGGVEAPSDTEPPAINLINLTSEVETSGLGQIIYNNSPEQLGKLSGKARTNDTTPTIRATTNKSSTCAIIDLNRDLNWTDIFKGNTNDDNGAPALTHILTLNSSNSSGIVGLHNFSIGCKDSSGNENRTSTSGKFTINITDGTPPNSTLWKPVNNALYTVGINTTNINFTFSALDNLDKNFSAYVYIDNILEFTNLTYLNGTNVSYFKTISSDGTHTWYVNTTDSFNNQNQSFINSFEIRGTVNVTMFLDGINDSRKYEFETTANITILVDEEVQTCIDFNNEEINKSCSVGNWSYYFNITELKVDRIMNGSKRFNLSSTNDDISIKIDNKTELVRFTINLTGYELNNEFPKNIEIDVDKRDGSDVVLVGKLRGKTLENNGFIYSNKFYNSTNISIVSGGSILITLNSTSINDIYNFSMEFRGSDLDLENEFSYIEHFNGTIESKGINETLSYQTDAPMGVFESFDLNNSKWSGGTCSLAYGTSKLTMSCGAGNSQELTYSDTAGDLRNSSKVVVYFDWSGSCSGGSVGYNFYATDGTSKILLTSDDIYLGSGSISKSYNITLTKKSSDYKSWSYSGDDSGTIDISSFDFTKQIALKWQPVSGGACSVDLTLHNINWSGAWLNYSINNGTYKPIGNFTSKVLNVTKTNISKATLSWFAYEPAGTRILGYISAECNSTPNFESVQNGITHTFVSNGNRPCVRFQLNSSINTTSPVVRKYTFDIRKGSLENISVDIGNDGDVDWQYIGILNDTTSPKKVNVTMEDFITYRSENCNGTLLCSYPIGISIVKGGTLGIDKVNSTFNIGDVSFNRTKIENHSIINMSVNFVDGLLEVGDIILSFKGSKNYSFYGHNKVNSTHSEGTDNKTVQVLYSPFNISYPWGIFSFIISVSSTPSNESMLNESLINPFGQEIGDNETYYSTPIYNITTSAYDNPVYVVEYLNESLNNCITIQIGPYSNATNTSVLSNVTLQDIAINITPSMINGTRLYHFVNLTNCNVSQNIDFSPVFCFNSWCQDCVRTGLLDSNNTINPQNKCLI